MNGELAQCVVLVAYGNACLHSAQRKAIEEGLARRNLFPFVRTIRFGDVSSRQPEEAALMWFRTLRRRGAERLWLLDDEEEEETTDGLSRRVLEGFSNANPRGIQVDYPSHKELWLPHWRFERGRWVVRYERTVWQAPKAQTALSVQQALDGLKKRLCAARRFAREVKEHFWEKAFKSALEALQDPHLLQVASDGEYELLLPDWGYSECAHRLLQGAGHADVFGGMGSWNDIGFSDQKRQATYERVSEHLYQAVCEAVVVAANAFCPYALPDAWPRSVTQLAHALQAGEDCAFALRDALLDLGVPEIAEHFDSRNHPNECWALSLLCGADDNRKRAKRSLSRSRS